jgi:small subunit ribosomal protein S16
MVKIRLARRGRKKAAMYDIVVADSRSPRDGKFIEKIGAYNPLTTPASVVLNVDKAVKWLLNGAEPTDTTRSILSHEGVMLKKHLQVGVNKGAITQETADERFAAWKDDKAGRVTGKKDDLAKSVADLKQTKLEAERKVNEARAAAIIKKNTVEEAVVEAPVEAAAEVVEAVVEAPVEAAAEVVEAVVEAPVEAAAEVVEAIVEAPVEAAAEVVEAVVEAPAAAAE